MNGIDNIKFANSNNNRPYSYSECIFQQTQSTHGS